MDEPSTWALIWLVTATVFGVGEMMAAGTFFLLPFAAGALLAAIVSLFGAPIAASWAVFLVGSLLIFLALKPLSRKMELSTPSPPGVGANRLLGVGGVVIEPVPAGIGSAGMVRVEGEEWRAEGRDGMGLSIGTEVRIIDVSGTRLIVEPDSTVGLNQL